MSEIEIKDCGPIERLTIPIPPGGGVVVLRARSGSGKTHALGAVGALVRGKGHLPARDGSPGAIVEGLGVRLSMGRRMARAGELECEALDGEDPSLMVDPGIKDPAAADSARYRALLNLAHAEVPLSAFSALVEGGERQLRELCRPTSLEARDAVAQAAAIKRDLEAAARSAESRAQNLTAEADAARKAADEIGGAPGAVRTASAQDARAAHMRAVRSHTQLEEQVKSGAQLREAAGEARAALDAMGERGTEAAITGARARVDDLAGEIAYLDGELARAKGELKTAQAAHRAETDARDQRAAVQRALSAADGAREIPAEEIAAAAAAVELAREEVETWALRQRTEGLRAEAERVTNAAAQAAIAGRKLREAAAGTERVLIDAVRAVCGDRLAIRDGRLYVTTDRGLELYEELSTGERWDVALDVALQAIGERALLVARQEAWQALDPQARADVAQRVRSRGIVLLTAAVDEGELRAEVYGDAAR